ncbi:MAG: UDP-glucose 4-epimerase GalE [Hyphomicrobiales bacterium]|nr:MAG: UDP-glucose 4-epimerase GalE [Hyphomicrobiales bacterium]
MTVLVTGAAGYIGCHMAYELLDAGEKVVILDNLSTGLSWALPKAATFVEGDVGDQPLVENLLRQHGVKSIIHFAASIVVPDSVTDPLGYYFNNTVKTRALIESAVRCGVEHFIFSSTAAVYGMTGDAPVSETAPLNPMSPYGSSKLMSEIILRDVSNAFPMRHVVLRYFNVAGADPKGRTGQSTPRATHLIKVAAETALGKRASMSVFGTDYPTPDGTCLRDYIHVTDLVGAHVVALEHLRKGGASDVFNCGYGRGFSVFEVIDAVKRVSGRDFKVDIAGRRPGDPARIVAGSDKIRSKLGWTPRFDDLDTIVAHALAWEEQLGRMPRVA